MALGSSVLSSACATETKYKHWPYEALEGFNLTFYAPGGGHLRFGLSVCPLVHNSVPLTTCTNKVKYMYLFSLGGHKATKLGLSVNLRVAHTLLTSHTPMGGAGS